MNQSIDIKGQFASSTGKFENLELSSSMNIYELKKEIQKYVKHSTFFRLLFLDQPIYLEENDDICFLDRLGSILDRITLTKRQDVLERNKADLQKFLMMTTYFVKKRIGNYLSIQDIENQDIQDIEKQALQEMQGEALIAQSIFAALETIASFYEK